MRKYSPNTLYTTSVTRVMTKDTWKVLPCAATGYKLVTITFSGHAATTMKKSSGSHKGDLEVHFLYLNTYKLS